jgi:hypothetical protein
MFFFSFSCSISSSGVNAGFKTELPFASVIKRSDDDVDDDDDDDDDDDGGDDGDDDDDDAGIWA